MPQPKKASRPRIDAIVRHIKSGSYDDEIDQIKAAIDERNKARQEAVLKTVRTVFGEKATVVTTPNLDGLRIPSEVALQGEKPTPVPARRQRPGGPKPSADPVADALSDDPAIREAEAAALARERELEAEMAAQSSGTIDPNDPEAGVESNSPLIGSIPS